MPDDKSKPGAQDRKRINITEDYELRDWAKKFRVPPEQLKEAIDAVGDNAEKVEERLKGRKAATRAGDK